MSYYQDDPMYIGNDCGWTESDDMIIWGMFVGFFILLTTLFSPYFAYTQASYLLRRRTRRRANAIAESTP